MPIEYQVEVFFPQVTEDRPKETPGFTWEDAYQWTKDRSYLNSDGTCMTNPHHWDKENIMREQPLTLSPRYFTWFFYFPKNIG